MYSLICIRQLRHVVRQVESTPVEQRQAPVGLLTTEHRDTWGPVSIKKVDIRKRN